MIKNFRFMLLMFAFITVFTACSKASAGGVSGDVSQNQQTQGETQPAELADSVKPSEPEEPAKSAEFSDSAKLSESEELSESAEPVNSEGQTAGSKAVVVYFSATGTTAEVAQCIAKTTGADILEIVPEIAYTSEDLNYHDDNCRANKEMDDDTARPAINSDLHAVSDYDIIYLGYPIWWGTAPRIIQTFMESYDLSNAAVFTFCTSGGSGIEKSVQDLQNLYPGIRVISGKRYTSASEADVQAWIGSLE